MDSDDEVDIEREAERKRREAERQKMLNAAGLKLRREPPAPPDQRTDDNKTRRPAPAAPKRRRKAPAIPTNLGSSIEEVDMPQEVGTQDAYARYEQYMAEARDRPQPAPSPRPPAVIHSPPAEDDAQPSPAPSQTGSHGRFSGFISRMVGTTSTPEPRKGPAISGPMSKVEEPEQTDPDSIGKTWGSLVDPGVLASMSDRERKRQEAIYEFITTEGAYNRDLQLIVQVFYAGLLTVLDEKAQAVVFANVEDILLANMAFFSALEQRQKTCRLYVDTIGDILAENMPAMQVYTPYCVNQAQAAHLLQVLRSQDSNIQAKLEVGLRDWLMVRSWLTIVVEGGPDCARIGLVPLPPNTE